MKLSRQERSDLIVLGAVLLIVINAWVYVVRTGGTTLGWQSRPAVTAP